MVQLNCTDFNNLYLSLNRLYILHPEKVEFMDVCKGYIRDVFISYESPKIDIDISTIGYKKQKWTHLINQYLCEEDILAFKEKLDSTTTLSATFYFKNKKKKDACLVGLVIGRINRKEPWSTLSVMYRACHTERKLAVDLLLINKLLLEYWEVNPTNINIYIPYCFCEAEFINGVWDVLAPDINRDGLSSDYPFMRTLLSSYKRRFKPDSPISPFTTMKKLQDFSQGRVDIDPIPANSLSIKEVIKR